MLQAKKRFWGSKPGFDFGDILHIGVNVLFVLVIYAMVNIWSLLPLAIALVLLSKWRIFAVQPRFWLPNIKANLTDIIVGIGTILAMDQAGHAWIALVWAALYVGWLLFLKPQTSELFVGLQAFWAQLLGITAIMMVASFVRISILMCVLIWVIAWATARHFFSNYEEPHYRTLGLLWGLMIAQLSWVMLHWLQYYIIFDMKIATLPLVVSVLSAAIAVIYHSYKKGTLHRGVVVENSLFALALLVLILATSRWVVSL